MALRQERDEDLESLLNKGALWAVTYGDLMSYLMIFFLLMFTFALKGKKSAETLMALQSQFGGKVDTKAAQRIQQKGKEKEVAEELSKKFQAKITEEKIQVTLSDKVLFDSGKADLKPEIYPTLMDFSKLAASMSNLVLVEGHTDNVPIHGGRYGSNFELSMARAYAVIRFLTEKGGLDPSRLSGAGFGEFSPVVPNDSPEHRAQNRRIEINLMRIK